MNAKPIERVFRHLIDREADDHEVHATLRLLAHGVLPGAPLAADRGLRRDPLGPLAQCMLADQLVQLDPWVVCDDLALPQALHLVGAGLDLLEGDARATVIRRLLRKFAGFIRIADQANRFHAEVALLRAVAREELRFHRGPNGPLAVIARVFITLRDERRRERRARAAGRLRFARHHETAVAAL